MKVVNYVQLAKFIKNNKKENLFLKIVKFQPISEQLKTVNENFYPIKRTIKYMEHTLGIQGIWLINSSSDYYSYFETDIFQGIEVNNFCTHFILAIKI